MGKQQLHDALEKLYSAEDNPLTNAEKRARRDELLEFFRTKEVSEYDSKLYNDLEVSVNLLITVDPKEYCEQMSITDFNRDDAYDFIARHIELFNKDFTLFEEIARKHCRVWTLERRNSDSLDFREVSVCGLKAALEAAYEAGFKDGKDVALKVF